MAIDGKTVTLADSAVYSTIGDVPNKVGYSQLKQWIQTASADFKSQGFEKLVTEGVRAERSTSANPGSVWRYVIDLT
ncbi:hypothetical protein LJC58_09955 [Lachnospiraceae bacterium OttesenSCG-928-D06]|nr:hypothetical protein [Lachnospiraceae bacterium OttesenSCG-928-D06]